MENRFSIGYQQQDGGGSTEVAEVIDEKTSRRYDLSRNSEARRFSALVNTIRDEDECFVFVGYKLKDSGASRGKATMVHVASVIDDDSIKRFDLRSNSGVRNFIAEVNDVLG